jgi:hypothetical protein
MEMFPCHNSLPRRPWSERDDVEVKSAVGHSRVDDMPSIHALNPTRPHCFRAYVTCSKAFSELRATSPMVGCAGCREPLRKLSGRAPVLGTVSDSRSVVRLKKKGLGLGTTSALRIIITRP